MGAFERQDQGQTFRQEMSEKMLARIATISNWHKDTMSAIEEGEKGRQEESDRRSASQNAERIAFRAAWLSRAGAMRRVIEAMENGNG